MAKAKEGCATKGKPEAKGKPEMKGKPPVKKGK